MSIKNIVPVVIESPYAGKNPVNFRRNIAYLHAAIQDCLKRGEVPYASHGFFPGALDDTIPEQREQGIQAGFRMAEALNSVGGFRAFYMDRGNSRGMDYGEAHAETIGQLHIARSLGDEWSIDKDTTHCDHKDGLDETNKCSACGTEFETVTLPKDAIAIALAYLAKKA